jgi:photosystem II stability/assembly factor-like uncharacterized protein
MNDHDVDRNLEADVRAELRRSIVPPPTPEYVRDRVERLASRAIGEETWRDAIPVWRRLKASLTALVAVLAIVVLVGAALAWRSRGGDTAVGPRTTGGSTPSPTLVGTPGPTFPPVPTGANRLVGQFGWIHGLAAFIVVEDRELHITTDGGITWSEARQLPAPTDLGLGFTDAMHGWTAWTVEDASGTRIVEYRTADGGRTWQASDVASVTAEPGTSLNVSSQIIDSEHALVRVGRVVDSPQGQQPTYRDCRLYESSDGGVTWSAGSAVTCGGFSAQVWADELTGVAMAGPGDTLATLDAGRSWRPAKLPIPSGISFAPRVLRRDESGRLRLAGSFSYTSGSGPAGLPLVIYESVDGGASWAEAYRTTPPDGSIIQDIWGFSFDKWLALEDVPVAARPFQQTRLIETRNGGRTWTVIPSVGFTSSAHMSWTDESHGMLQGTFMDCSDPSKSCGATGTVFITNDGGRTWHQVPF